MSSDSISRGSRRLPAERGLSSPQQVPHADGIRADSKPNQLSDVPADWKVRAPILIVFKLSLIHGTGGFAAAVIPKGTRVIEYLGRKISKSESIECCRQGNKFIFYLDAEHDLDGDVPSNPARLLNHSCSPNCDAELLDGRVWIISNRDVAAGEEITFNYNFDLEDYKDYPCQCGSPNCVGYIVADVFFERFRRL